MASLSDHKTLDCPLCFKTFTTPHVLPCSHKLCAICLGRYNETNVQGGSKFSCPLCEAETVPSDSKLASEDANSISSSKSHDTLHNANKTIKNLYDGTKLSTIMCAAQVEKFQYLSESPVTFVKTVKRDKLGSNTWFTGGTCLGDGRLVMCDCYNKRLVELNDEYNFVKEYKIDSTPTDVAAGNKDSEIYIAVNVNCIYKCTLYTDLTVVSRIKAPLGTWSIAVKDDNIIVGTKNAVVILTQGGSKVRNIPKSGKGSYVAVSRTERTIYHKNNHDVVCRTWRGDKVFRYRDQQLKDPFGICTDKYNNVYICGADSHNVHQVSHDGRRSRIIQLQYISWPCCVVLNSQKSQLIVTSWNEDTVCEIQKLVL